MRRPGNSLPRNAFNDVVVGGVLPWPRLLIPEEVQLLGPAPHNLRCCLKLLQLVAKYNGGRFVVPLVRAAVRSRNSYNQK